MVYILLTALFMLVATFYIKKLLKNNSILGIYNPRKNPNLPPVVKAWPLVGSIYMLVKDPISLMQKNYKKYGSVFTIKVLGQSITMLIGPEVSSHFHTAAESELSRGELLNFTIPMFGPNVAYGVSGSRRRQQFQFLMTALKPEMLRQYVGPTFAEAEDYFSKWKDCGTVDLTYELQCLITLTTTRCFLGADFSGNINKDVSSLIRDLAAGVRPISYLFPFLPIPAHNRRDLARRKLIHIFSNIINSRKSSPRSEKDEDLLQTLIESTYTDGKRNTNEQVAGLLIALFFVSQHPTGNAAMWIGAYLLQNETYFSKVLEEQKELLHRHGPKIDFDILEEMDVLYRCIREAIRLGGFPVNMPRYCQETFSVTTKEGIEYTIPRGHIVATCPAVAQRLDYVRKDPDRYDPDRYLSIEEKVVASQPFSDIAFGGGRHPCPGEVFTYIQMKIIWSCLIRNFELDLASSFPAGRWNGKEKFEILVHYKRRQLSI